MLGSQTDPTPRPSTCAACHGRGQHRGQQRLYRAGPPPTLAGMIAMREIQRYCDAIAAAFKPRRIILFGSYAYGKPTADSDVDVLVVMAKSQRLGHRPALRIREKVEADFPVDVMVRDTGGPDPRAERAFLEKKVEELTRDAAPFDAMPANGDCAVPGFGQSRRAVQATHGGGVSHSQSPLRAARNSTG